MSTILYTDEYVRITGKDDGGVFLETIWKRRNFKGPIAGKLVVAALWGDRIELHKLINSLPIWNTTQ